MFDGSLIEFISWETDFQTNKVLELFIAGNIQLSFESVIWARKG
jgi:hypothetical protein